MTASLRAVRALVLLAGFHLMGLALLGVLAVADWLLLTRFYSVPATFLILTAVGVSLAVAVPVLRGMAAFLRAGRWTEPDGLPLTPQEQPELWSLVREAARAAGTAAPDELVLDGAVNAAVGERSRLLGLLPGRRRLQLGLPLLAGLTVPGLQVVLAHEFGHFGNHDTRLAAVTMRGRAAVGHTVAAFHRGSGRAAYAMVGNLFVRYARFYLTATQSVARRQELAADRASAHHVGRDATAAALRRMPCLRAAHDHYLDVYALMGAPVRALPPVGEFHGGFRRLLAARGPEDLAELAGTVRARRPSPFDSHPPLAERIARIEELPDDGRPDDPDAPPALGLLRDVDRTTAALENATLTDAATRAHRLDWPDLVMVRTLADAEKDSAPLQKAVARAVRTASTTGPATAAGAPTGGAGREATDVADGLPGPAADLPDLAGVLDAIDAGLLWQAADRLPKPPQAGRLTGRSARNFVRPALWEALAALVYLHLAAEGQARPDVGWSTGPRLALPPAWEREMDAAIDAAVGDEPDTAALRALLDPRTADPVPA